MRYANDNAAPISRRQTVYFTGIALLVAAAITLVVLKNSWFLSLALAGWGSVWWARVLPNRRQWTAAAFRVLAGLFTMIAMVLGLSAFCIVITCALHIGSADLVEQAVGLPFEVAQARSALLSMGLAGTVLFGIIPGAVAALLHCCARRIALSPMI